MCLNFVILATSNLKGISVTNTHFALHNVMRSRHVFKPLPSPTFYFLNEMTSIILNAWNRREEFYLPAIIKPEPETLSQTKTNRKTVKENMSNKHSSTRSKHALMQCDRT